MTQKRWRDCEGGERKQWWRHFLLVTGYATLFALVVVFLPVFQVERGGLAGWHWTALFGYYGTAVLLGHDAVDRPRPLAEARRDPPLQPPDGLALPGAAGRDRR